MYHDLRTGGSGFIPDLPTSGADMPVIINHHSGDSYLFYRFDNAGTYDLRVALLEQGNTFTVNPTGLVFSGIGAAGSSGTPSPTHMIIDDTADVQYYDVSPFMDIMMYADLAGHNITNLYFDGAPEAVPDLSAHFWTAAPGPHFVDGNIGNPTANYFTPSEQWDGSSSSATTLHAERVTFDWVP
jgi:hypothetical protein